MQFKVPQFLDIEDKIFGPFTFKQFIYLAGGAGICFVLFKLLGIGWGILPILAVAGFSMALTFYRPNNTPFVDVLAAGFRYITQKKLYIWQKEGDQSTKKPEIKNSAKSIETVRNNSRLSGSKLRDLAWSLDVLDLSKQQSADNIQ